MLKQPMIEKLAAMRLLGMAEGLKAQEQDPSARELSSWNGSACSWTNSGTGERTRRSHDA
jgi:hypothetical protein